MEEFKNLKEIIELCKEELDKNDENVNATLDFEDLKELQNLIKKYKEQEKMIKLMAKQIKINTTDDGLSIRPATIEEKIEFFRKKAKGE